MLKIKGKNMSLTISDDIIWKEFKDKITIINIEQENDTLYEVKGVAINVFLGITEKKDIETIIKDILSTYKIAEKQVRSDIDNFLRDLSRLKIIV